jgi:glutamate 5-kinase
MKIVIKIGTSTLTYANGCVNIRRIESLCKCVSDVINAGNEVILVSSGAIGCGLGKIGLGRDELTLEQKQAAAAVGQCELIDMYSRLFGEYGHTVGQLLLTRDVTDIPHRREHAENTLRVLIQLGCIPVINENDTVSSEEIMYGGNDTLAATVAKLCHADLLINMSDINGLYDSDPRTNKDAKFIEYVDSLSDDIFSFGKGAGTARGTGGMAAKLESAQYCTERGIPMIILNGADPEILYNVFDGEFVGTYFAAQK